MFILFPFGVFAIAYQFVLLYTLKIGQKGISGAKGTYRIFFLYVVSSVIFYIVLGLSSACIGTYADVDFFIVDTFTGLFAFTHILYVSDLILKSISNLNIKRVSKEEKKIRENDKGI